MSSKTPISPDELFKRLGGHEEEYDPQAWDHMRTLLDKSDRIKPAVLLPDEKNKPNTNISLTKLISIIMVTLSIVSLLTWWATGTGNVDENASKAAEKDNTGYKTESTIPYSASKDLAGGSTYNSLTEERASELNTAAPESKKEANAGAEELNKTTAKKEPSSVHYKDALKNKEANAAAKDQPVTNEVSAAGAEKKATGNKEAKAVTKSLPKAVASAAGTGNKATGITQPGVKKTGTAKRGDAGAEGGSVVNKDAAGNTSPKDKKDLKGVVAGNKTGKETPATDAKKAGAEAMAPADTSRKPTTPRKYQKTVVRKVWVPDEYEYVTLPREKTIEDFWIGIHFTMQKPEFKVPMDSNGTLGYMDNTQGFNIQFMSGNAFKSKYWGAYGGLDWGMQFYGRTPNTNVVLNTAQEDSGYTRLKMSSMDFLVRGHWEYARYAFVPYVNLMAGPRIFMTGQKVAAYRDLGENESSTSHNVHTSASLMYGFGAGARLKISRVVSLDARYEMMWGTPAKIVDLNQSKFNGLNYQLVTHKVDPVYSQVKVGLIFNLSSEKKKAKLVTPGHYREEVYDSMEVDPKDSNVRYLPCNCPCDTKKTRSPQKIEDDYDETPKRTPRYDTPPVDDGNRNNGGSNNGGSKNSFPGVKTPTSTPKPTPPVRTPTAPPPPAPKPATPPARP